MLRLYEVSVDRNALVRNMDLNIERQIIEKDNDNINKNKEENYYSPMINLLADMFRESDVAGES